jgi:acyl-homoserine lactone acylase PvdQ
VADGRPAALRRRLDLAEILGPAGLESDRESRRLRLRRIAEDAYVTLPAADRAAFAAYTAASTTSSPPTCGLPLEFTLLGYQPRPVERGGLPAALPAHVPHLTTTWRTRSSSATCWPKGDRAKVDFLYPMRGMGDASRAPTPGPSRAATRRRASRCSRTTCTWSIRCPASGT